jgi:hypothetical protein
MLNTCVEARSALKSDTAKKWVMLETDVNHVLRDLIKLVKDKLSHSSFCLYLPFIHSTVANFWYSLTHRRKRLGSARAGMVVAVRSLARARRR